MRRNSGRVAAVITPGAVAMPSSPSRPVTLVTRAGRDSAALTSQPAAFRALIIGIAA
jgi:hypothetical protein